ncbi:jg20675, partial [Pararge aegeria aegeria]
NSSLFAYPWFEASHESIFEAVSLYQRPQVRFEVAVLKRDLIDSSIGCTFNMSDNKPTPAFRASLPTTFAPFFKSGRTDLNNPPKKLPIP